jgi:tau tubulin kinase
MFQLASESAKETREKAMKPAMEQRRNISSGGGSRRSNLRPTSGNSSRFSSTRDHSITQYALIDDDNVSALQQLTRGGGGVTLASQWKSQFDDSEETDNENEWKHDKSQMMSQSNNISKHGQKAQQKVKNAGNQIENNDKSQRPKSQVNPETKEKFSKMREMLPHCWSEPLIAEKLRREIEPPILQKTSFDDTVRVFKNFFHFWFSIQEFS